MKEFTKTEAFSLFIENMCGNKSMEAMEFQTLSKTINSGYAKVVENIINNVYEISTILPLMI